MSQPIPSNTFLNEAEDLLGQIEEITLEVRPGDAPGEPINHLFRAFHTIKGSGAMFGFDTVAAFTHHVETVLDKVREGVVPLSQELIDLILASKDQIKHLLDEAQGGSGVPPEKGQRIITALNGLLPGGSDVSLPVKASSTAAAPIPQAGAAAGSCLHTFRIRFRPVPGLMASGTDPLMLLNELRALGDCRIVADPTAIPPLGQLQPDQCYLAWDVTLATERGIDAIKDVFIFVDDGSCVAIEPVVIANPPAGPATTAAVCPSPAALEGAGAQRSVPCQDAARKPTAKAKDSSTRVPSERLDRLVTLVGEMVMNQSRLTQVAAGAGLPMLTAPVEVLERLVAELRDNVLGICMMPIGTTFSRYKRLVHDLSAELGKEIDLVTEGAETELDKTVLDQLGDPLVHLIRNCIDHGIEPAQARAQASKPPRGSIRLAAAHIGSSVVITIQDDGRGLDPDIIRAKAVEKKLIAPDSAISKEELFNLIFLPGFSTAHAVTSVSGRGVGMDVVKRQMDSLRGSIQLASELGKGTTVSLTLPLTLAIIDGLLVELAGDQFIIPMSAVTENVELPRAERSRNNGRNVVAVRGDLIPYIRLREIFSKDGAEPEIEKIVIVRHGTERVGLVVDRVFGSHQTVIQSLGRFYRDIGVVSGATIMGDGRVALILDLAGIVRQADRQAGGDPSFTQRCSGAVAQSTN